MAADITTDGTPAGTEDRRALATSSDYPEAVALRDRPLRPTRLRHRRRSRPLSESWRVERDRPAYVVRQNRAELEAEPREGAAHGLSEGRPTAPRPAARVAAPATLERDHRAPVSPTAPRGEVCACPPRSPTAPPSSLTRRASPARRRRSRPAGPAAAERLHLRSATATRSPSSQERRARRPPRPPVRWRSPPTPRRRVRALHRGAARRRGRGRARVGPARRAAEHRVGRAAAGEADRRDVAPPRPIGARARSMPSSPASAPSRVVAVGAVAGPAGVETVSAAATPPRSRRRPESRVGALGSPSSPPSRPGLPREPPFGAVPARAEPLTGVLALAQPADADVAAVANARAAGVAGDARRHRRPAGLGAAVTAIADARASCTLLLGPARRADRAGVVGARRRDRLAAARWRAAPLRRAPVRRDLRHPGRSGARGARRAGPRRRRSRGRRRSPSRTARSPTCRWCPSLEIITTVAAGSAGGDGDYSNELSADGHPPLHRRRRRRAGMYVVLDLQPGRSDFLTPGAGLRGAAAAAERRPRPRPGVAARPRRGAARADRPGVGRRGRQRVELARRPRARRRDCRRRCSCCTSSGSSMLQDRGSIRRDRPELEFLIHVDGQGAQPDKQATWNALHERRPRGHRLGLEELLRRGPADAHPRRDDGRGRRRCPTW